MNRRSTRHTGLLILMVFLLTGTAMNVFGLTGPCRENTCRSMAPAPPNHESHHQADSQTHCEGLGACCHLQAAAVSREPLLLTHRTKFPSESLCSAVLPEEQNAPRPGAQHTLGLIDRIKPGPIIPLYLQNLTLLC